jgi:hypothetical protein
MWTAGYEKRSLDMAWISKWVKQAVSAMVTWRSCIGGDVGYEDVAFKFLRLGWDRPCPGRVTGQDYIAHDQFSGL